MDKVFVVTTGEYSDYGIAAIFSDEATAMRVRDQLNALRSYAHADVEEYEVYGPDYTIGRHASRSTIVSASGTVVNEWESSDTDIRGEYRGKSTTHIKTPRMALDSYEVYTHGDAERVPQAHADAVAKLRAELIGL